MDITTTLAYPISFLISALLLINLGLLALNVFLRAWRRWRERENKKTGPPFKMMAVMGSGGHTTEMVRLLESLSADEIYSTRFYVMANSDALSRQKVLEFEEKSRGGCKENELFFIETITRARKVGQSFLTSIPTTLIASWHSARLLWKLKPDVVLSNGPAIGLPICLFARFFDCLRIHRSRIVFVESICRVRSLSLTGRLLYHLRVPDAFLVQWPDLHEMYNRTQFIGRLV